MKITFADSRPADATLVAHVCNRGSLPDGLERALTEGASAARFKGGSGQVFEGFVERDGTVVRVALAGAGSKDAENRNINCEKAGAALAGKYLSSGASTIVLDFEDSGLTGEEIASVLLGLRLRTWRQDAYRTKMKDEQKKTLTDAIVVGAPGTAQTAWDVEEALCEGIEFTRHLVAEPANKLYPESFVAQCRDALQGTGIEITVLTDDDMEKLGMGALLGVGLGSERPSRLLAMKWNGGEPGQRPMAFVGKGVTFDTGGISLKPGPGMEDMKWDMGGAGAVAGAMVALAKRKARANVVGVVGLVENMPDGRAMRPGDIVTSMSGQTIEVLNTDAEGRLVLCDALHWTQKEFDPVAVVDFATLTGAMIIALGSEHGGIFSNDDDLADKLMAAGKSTGDKLWRFPLMPEYDKLLNSPIADMKNIGPRGAGSITAAQFLQRFIDKDRPWAHCDIAGMVWADKAGQTWDKGATGYGVRIIDQYVRDVLEG
ncbi:leucyl aminopeptidase [Erythrobacter litoralis]|uniref:Probable cytosol aminopeptidase n=1 Tax=Erythrobacter litoralis (strain HTCC2594) TaxID=314225 RepID=Q2N8X3_ERYLH|nr:leucyl aminopeptidase [Erythrobacter litoralis]ABC63868.1 leucyl aminopeptidase [Erythrobacter litoralis HTCC2594]